jgi:hypothetical protein
VLVSVFWNHFELHSTNIPVHLRTSAKQLLLDFLSLSICVLHKSRPVF